MSRRAASVAVVVALAAAPVLAQGLGDASKKERERRARSTATVKEYTEDDLEGLTPIANEEEANGSPAASPAAEPSRDVTSRQGSERSRGDDEEQVWRDRVAAARARIAEERAAYEYWANLSLVPGYELVDENNRVIARSAEELQAATARAKARLEAAEKGLEDLLERARREGVLPGWLR
jgi:hypothetical protein